MVTHFTVQTPKILNIFWAFSLVFCSQITIHAIIFFFSFSRSSLSLYIIHRGWEQQWDGLGRSKGWREMSEYLDWWRRAMMGSVEAFLQRRLQDFLHLCCRLPSSLSKLSLPPSSLLLLCNNLSQSCSQSVLPPINHNFSFHSLVNLLWRLHLQRWHHLVVGFFCNCCGFADLRLLEFWTFAVAIFLSGLENIYKNIINK